METVVIVLLARPSPIRLGVERPHGNPYHSSLSRREGEYRGGFLPGTGGNCKCHRGRMGRMDCALRDGRVCLASPCGISPCMTSMCPSRGHKVYYFP
jgi:hypothetical protein